MATKLTDRKIKLANAWQALALGLRAFDALVIERAGQQPIEPHDDAGRKEVDAWLESCQIWERTKMKLEAIYFPGVIYLEKDKIESQIRDVVLDEAGSDGVYQPRAYVRSILIEATAFTELVDAYYRE